MKRIIIIIGIWMVGIGGVRAQINYQQILDEVERNNGTLKTLRKVVEAEQWGNKSATQWAAPEVEYEWMKAGGTAGGAAQEWSAAQSFEWATLLGKKRGVMRSKNQQVEWMYRMRRMQELLAAQLCVIDWVYLNGVLQDLAAQKKHAEVLVKSWGRKLETGEGNVLAYNNVRLALAKVEAEIMRRTTEREEVALRLAGFNGGKRLEVSAAEYAPISLPLNFDAWLTAAVEKMPELAYAQQSVVVRERELGWKKSLALPSVRLGVKKSVGRGEQAQGFTIGLSVPLWSNKHKVKQAKAALAAAQEEEKSERQRLSTALQQMYERAQGLKQTAARYRQSLEMANNSRLLKKALEAGEISVLEYTIQIGFYYETMEEARAAERDYQKAYAELCAMEL